MNTGNNSDMSEESVIRKLQNGSLNAFEVIFDKYRKGVFAYVNALVRDRGLAEDITQDCFLKLVRKIKSINPERGVSGWLYRTARNGAFDVMRKKRKEFLPGEAFITERQNCVGLKETDDPGSRVMAGEEEEMLKRNLDILSDKEREIILLRFYGGLTFREIAGVVRRPLGTVLWSARRSLLKLRNNWREL